MTTSNFPHGSIIINQVNAIMTNPPAASTVKIKPPDIKDNKGELLPGIIVETINVPGCSIMPIPTSVARSLQVANTETTSTAGSTTPNTSGLNVQDSIGALSKIRLSDLIRETDPMIVYEEEVEETLLSYVDDFVDRVLSGAATISKARHMSLIEMKDVQQYLSYSLGYPDPGHNTDEPKFKRNPVPECHKQRLAAIRKALKKD